MIRSQVYLTKAERSHLHQLSRKMGKSQSELIREAIDIYIDAHLKQSANKLVSIQAMKGIWRDRDLPDFSKIRKEFDRQEDED